MSFFLLFQSSFNINLHISFYHINELVKYINIQSVLHIHSLDALPLYVTLVDVAPVTPVFL